jgi:hypothetical protein
MLQRIYGTAFFNKKELTNIFIAWKQMAGPSPFGN